MRFVYFVLAIGFIVITPDFLSAQTSNTFNGWLAITAYFKLDTKFTLRIEGNLRSGDEWQQIQTVIFRPGIQYIFARNQTLTLGYAYISNAQTIDGIRGYTPEDRIWEQYSIMNYFSAQEHYISFQNRLRLEQRFIGQSVVDNDQLVTESFEFVQRLRYFFRMIVPFIQSPKKEFIKGSFFSLQNEVFVNIGNTSVVNGKFFNQNRAYFSVGYRFSPKNDTEVGYIYQFVEGTGTAKMNNHIIQLATYIHL